MKRMSMQDRWKADNCDTFVILQQGGIKKHMGPGLHPSGTPQTVHDPVHQGQGTKKEKAQLRAILKFKGPNGEHVRVEKKGSHWEVAVVDQNNFVITQVYNSYNKDQMIRSGNRAVQDIEAEV